MKIAITSPLSGKKFCFPEHIKTIELVIQSNPEIEFVWVINDNGNDESFSKWVKSYIDKFGIKYIYCKDETPNGIDGNKYEQVNAVYQKLFYEMLPECDYVLNIEDDISCENPEALRLMLPSFEDERVATVVGFSYSRDQGRSFGRIQGSTRIDGHIYKRGFEKESGSVVLETGCQGFWLTRYEYLMKFRIPPFETDTKHADSKWSQIVKLNGMKILMNWGVKLKHFYKLPDGRVDYVAYGHNPSRVMLDEIRIEVPRAGSPLFITVPKAVLIPYLPANIKI